MNPALRGMLKGIVIGALAITPLFVITEAIKENDRRNTELKIDHLNNHIADYRNRYFEIICYNGGVISLRDWADSDFDLHGDGRLEYFSVEENRVVSVYFSSAICKSIPPHNEVSSGAISSDKP